MEWNVSSFKWQHLGRSVLAVDRRSRTREQKITSGRSPFT